MIEVPKHVAIVMDGNGRWAERRGHRRIFGHVRGSTRIKPVVEEANRLGIRAITFFAFSTENWARPFEERRVLWNLLKKYLRNEVRELDRQNIRLKIIGELARLEPDVRAVAESSMEKLQGNTGLQLTFAVSYGARKELLRASELFANDCMKGLYQPSDLTESLFERYLWTSQLEGLSDVDLFIRTSGERRLSNFLLWQSAYAEFMFMDVYWPEFTPAHLREALHEFQNRDRRYGGLTRSNVKKGMESLHDENQKAF